MRTARTAGEHAQWRAGRRGQSSREWTHAIKIKQAIQPGWREKGERRVRATMRGQTGGQVSPRKLTSKTTKAGIRGQARQSTGWVDKRHHSCRQAWRWCQAKKQVMPDNLSAIQASSDNIRTQVGKADRILEPCR